MRISALIGYHSVNDKLDFRFLNYLGNDRIRGFNQYKLVPLADIICFIQVNQAIQVALFGPFVPKTGIDLCFTLTLCVIHMCK